MKKKNLLTLGIITALLLTGCSTGSNAETEELKKQIANLEQQIADMEQPVEAKEEVKEETKAETPLTENTPAAETAQEPAKTEAADTSTIKDLTKKVDDFIEKADAASPGNDNAKNTETFFALKKENKQIENELDRYEDAQEQAYRNGTLSRDDFRAKEREIERLEDKLDNAEDRLEYTFGIDD